MKRTTPLLLYYNIHWKVLHHYTCVGFPILIFHIITSTVFCQHELGDSIKLMQAVQLKTYGPWVHNTAYLGDLWCPQPGM